MPSGAATAHTAVTSSAPRSASSSIVWTIEPPVASIGSSTNTGRPASDSGSDTMYVTAWWVSSSRAMPTNPTCDSGTNACAASTIPSPARSTGTSSGGCARP